MIVFVQVTSVSNYLKPYVLAMFSFLSIQAYDMFSHDNMGTRRNNVSATRHTLYVSSTYRRMERGRPRGTKGNVQYNRTNIYQALPLYTISTILLNDLTSPPGFHRDKFELSKTELIDMVQHTVDDIFVSYTQRSL